jgi:hypothetical protein
MPWSTTRPGTQAKYRTARHRAERAKWVRQMERVGFLICAQPECVMYDRIIERFDAWHVGHDASGTAYIGPVHPTCNVRDAALRANARSKVRRVSRWSL